MCSEICTDTTCKNWNTVHNACYTYNCHDMTALPKSAKQVTVFSGHKTHRHVIQKLTRTSHSQQLTAFAKKIVSPLVIVRNRPTLPKLVQTKQRFKMNSKTKTKSQYSPFRLLKFSASHSQSRLHSTDFLFSSGFSRKSQISKTIHCGSVSLSSVHTRPVGPVPNYTSQCSHMTAKASVENL